MHHSYAGLSPYAEVVSPGIISLKLRVRLFATTCSKDFFSRDQPTSCHRLAAFELGPKKKGHTRQKKHPTFKKQFRMKASMDTGGFLT